MEQFCEGIGLEDGAKALIRGYRMDELDYARLKAAFYRDSRAFIRGIRHEAALHVQLLYLFVRFAADVYSAYKRRGISDKVYWDTFSDIRIWSDMYYRKNGEFGISEYSWLKEHVQLKLFRLGRLQFQPFVMETEVELNGSRVKKDQIVLNVHIPEGEPLLPQAVEASFQEAADFFRGISPVFVCHSWLLYPGLSELLGDSSNIAHFQKQFEIYATDEECRKGEEWVFGSLQENPLQYEERTSLQRALKWWLASGRTFGSGSGVRLHPVP
ncbi:acyltransferase domain-containing protein [Paenibacillus pasadenensis]|uniref:acyltransferase domain-containing protein n=1 Tax=Paenibacillus pasadenensis TaxID=217090 RepID=UPI00203EE3FB|nr:acyltransferase domain-containing protein [Paenibacillus pasadenensis]MCM3747250.1 acyltransferase domain-containing protein [Paenibacillus pasadenensis]